MGGGILKVDSFLTHQLDPKLIKEAGKQLANCFKALGVNKILTAETSGIAPALMTAMALEVPLVYARKSKLPSMPKDVITASAPSRTKGKEVCFMISPEYLSKEDRVVVIDDFITTGGTIMALVTMARMGGANVIGVGVMIEKLFANGRARLDREGLPLHSLIVITKMTDNEIIFG